MRILVSINSLIIGGGEIGAVKLAKGLQALGHEIVFGVDSIEGPLQKDLQAVQIPIVETGLGFSVYPRTQVHQRIWRSYKRLKPHAFDVWVSFRYTSHWPEGVVAGFLGIPYIVGRINIHQRAKGWWLRSLIADKITLLTAAMRPILYPGAFAAKCQVIPYGVDVGVYATARDRRETTRAALGWRSEDVACIYVANLKKGKGHNRLLDIFQSVVQKNPSVKLALVGRDQLDWDIQKKVSAMDLGRSVWLLGERSDVPDLLAAADIMVFPSEHEGFGLSIIEAMGAGLPAIVNDAPWSREIIHNDETGFLRSTDDLAAWTWQLLDLAGSKERRIRIGNAAREAAMRKFSERTMAQAYQSLMTTLQKSGVRRCLSELAKRGKAVFAEIAGILRAGYFND
ncbi:MAG: glycosyltransferase family 4 protein [Lentisphaeria bacterium]|nr:glycosyltransferase family 4 protein [Lentisphaeria bacterium]